MTIHPTITNTPTGFVSRSRTSKILSSSEQRFLLTSIAQFLNATVDRDVYPDTRIAYRVIFTR
jgi:hypothetical protein